MGDSQTSSVQLKREGVQKFGQKLFCGFLRVKDPAGRFTEPLVQDDNPPSPIVVDVCVLPTYTCTKPSML